MLLTVSGIVAYILRPARAKQKVHMQLFDIRKIKAQKFASEKIFHHQ